MAEIQKAKKTKKQRKYGRNAKSCAAYKMANRRERNKVLRLARHLKMFPDDKCASSAMGLAKIAIRGF